MRYTPFFIVTAASAIIQILYTIAVTAVTFFLTRSLDLGSIQGPEDLGPYQLVMLTGCIGTLLAPVVHAGTGALYSFLHWREEDITAEIGALGGAASAGLARFASGAVSVLLTILVYPIFMNQIMQTAPGPMPPELQPVLGFMTIGNMAGGLINTCTATFISAGLGAVGGALAAALFKGRPAP
ncbi:MAG: hypothetical protein EHM70_17925 [Chloroflexota bacterium]|nr:MAG: hypothetical protein EHM70_17925 [Chloroflexota bacterium]